MYKSQYKFILGDLVMFTLQQPFSLFTFQVWNYGISYTLLAYESTDHPKKIGSTKQRVNACHRRFQISGTLFLLLLLKCISHIIWIEDLHSLLISDSLCSLFQRSFLLLNTRSVRSSHFTCLHFLIHSIGFAIQESKCDLERVGSSVYTKRVTKNIE